MRLSDLELIESTLRSDSNLCLNYSCVEAIDIDGAKLTRWPYSSDNPQVLEVREVHKAWRKLHHLIKELQTQKQKREYAQITIKLNDY